MVLGHHSHPAVRTFLLLARLLEMREGCRHLILKCANDVFTYSLEEEVGFETLRQWFSIIPMLEHFNTAPHVVVTPNHVIISL